MIGDGSGALPGRPGSEDRVTAGLRTRGAAGARAIPTYEGCADILDDHLVPAEDVLTYAGRDLADPRTDAARTRSYPWSMALANLTMLGQLVDAMDGLLDWRDRTVLDAGCGPGLLAQGIAALGAAVIGIDAQPAMLSAAEVLGARAAGVDLAEGDLTELAHPDDSFDVVVCGDVPLSDAIRRELRRVVRPGGRLVCKRTGIAPGCTFAWDPALDHRYRTAIARGMDVAGPPWSTRAPGWGLEDLIRESGSHPDAFTTVLGQASAPLPDVWRAYLQQRFATFEGPFAKAGARAGDWEHLSAPWRPGPQHLLTRRDTHVTLPVTFVVVRAPEASEAEPSRQRGVDTGVRDVWGGRCAR